MICLGLSVIGAAGMLLLGFKKFPQEPSCFETPQDKAVKADGFYQKVVILGLVFGFYFIAEHGILNWWSMYCQQGLGLSGADAGTGVSLFFAAMTIGRFVLAPFVQKLGTGRSIAVLGGLGSILYILGVLLGAKGIYLLGISGIFLSIVYPTIVLFLQELFPKENLATATGLIISFGTVFDILFNALFGGAVDRLGFGILQNHFYGCNAVVLFQLFVCKRNRGG